MRKLMTNGKGNALVLTLTALLTAVLLVTWAAGLVPVEAQSDDGETVSGRIVARRLADGQTGLGWRPTGATEPVLPASHLFSTGARIGVWLHFGPVVADGVELGQINARLRSSGKIEFAFTPTDGERILPEARYFPVDPRHGRWLRSSEITFSIAVPDWSVDDRGPVRQPTVAEMEEAILAVLFGGEPAQANYNDWGCPTIKSSDRTCGDDYSAYNTSESATGGYAGGHSGWDAQTLSVVGNRPTRNEPFYSLTSGQVIFVGNGSSASEEDEHRAIAVWDGNRTTRYLHARESCVEAGQSIAVGQPLGIQGNSGLSSRANDREHVHVELQTGRSHLYGFGADSTHASRRTIDPFPHMFHAFAAASFSDFDPRDGERLAEWRSENPVRLVRVRDTSDVFAVWKVGDKEFGRLILNRCVLLTYAAVEPEVDVISLQDLDRYQLSTLVRRNHPDQNEADKVWHLSSEPGADSGSRAWVNVTQAQFERWFDPDSIFTVNKLEFGVYQRTDDLRGADLPWLRQQQGS